MTSRGGEQPQDGPDERREPRAKGRRWGRGRGGDETPPEPVGEDFGWIDDLRTAKQQRTELGPEGGPVPPVRPPAAPPVGRGAVAPPSGPVAPRVGQPVHRPDSAAARPAQPDRRPHPTPAGTGPEPA
ncbi:hypothetical protein ACFUYE_32575, partial [Micromonospora humida]